MSAPTIWKYELRVTDVQQVEMPAGARLLHVAGQEVIEWRPGIARHEPMLWAKVDPDTPRVNRLIRLVPTGYPAPDDDESVYVGTAICGGLVWHVYDGGEVA